MTSPTLPPPMFTPMSTRQRPALLGGQDPMLILSLSLNLMLLAFFVMLNASADIDTARARSVLDGVQQTFATPQVDDSQPAAQTTKAVAQDALRSSLSTAFVPVLEGRDVVVRSQADRLLVSAPYAAFFEPDTDALRASLPVLDRLAAILAAPPDGLRYEILITVNAPARDYSLATRQAGSLAEDILRRGVAPALLTVGAAPAPDRSVDLVFMVLGDEDSSLSVISGMDRS